MRKVSRLLKNLDAKGATKAGGGEKREMRSNASSETRPDSHEVLLDVLTEGVSMSSNHEDCVLNYHVELYILDEACERVEIGTLEAVEVDIDHVEEVDLDLLEVMDHHSDLCRYIDLVSIDDQTWNTAVMRALQTDDPVIHNFVIVNRLKILPAYRGHGYGLEALRVFLRRVTRSCTMAAILPFPLQFEGREDPDPELQLEKFTGSEPHATQRLRSHYGRLGFKRVSKTPFMVMSLI